MSNHHIDLVRKATTIKGPSRAILIVLADHSNDNDECWLAHSSIADESGLGKSTVKKHLKLLKSDKWVSWQERFTTCGDQDSNLYKLHLGGGAPRNPPQPPRNPGVGHDVTQGGAPRSYKASVKPQEEPIKEPFDSEAFKTAWQEWTQHRREIKKPLTPTSIRSQFKKFAGWGETRTLAAITHSIESGWQGIFEPNGTKAQPTQPAKPGTTTINGQTYRTT